MHTATPKEKLKEVARGDGSHLVKLGDGGQVEEHRVVLNLDREGQELHVLVLHVVQALAADNVF